MKTFLPNTLKYIYFFYIFNHCALIPLFTLHAAFVLIPRPKETRSPRRFGGVGSRAAGSWELEEPALRLSFQGFLAGAPSSSSCAAHLVCREVPGMPTAHFDVIEDRSGFSQAAAIAWLMNSCPTRWLQHWGPRKISEGKGTEKGGMPGSRAFCNFALIGAGVKRMRCCFQWQK